MIIGFETYYMAHPTLVKNQAIKLRKQGYSLNEISNVLKISKGTLSPWLSRIELSTRAQDILHKKQILGQYKTVLLKRKVAQKQKSLLLEAMKHELNMVSQTKLLMQLYCSLLWWCEGNKDTTQVRFTNSDPTLIANFLYTLRSGFELDESKFRVLVHIHDYHIEVKQKEYWSTITDIPISQFYKSYHKPHTGIRKHDNYQGTIAISYYDAKIAKQLEALYNAFTLMLGGVR